MRPNVRVRTDEPRRLVNGRHGVRWVVVTVALAWCAVLLVGHAGLGVLACSYADTSDCAPTRHKDGVYRGRLVDTRGRIVASASFAVDFTEPAGLVAGFSTDEAGAYCIMWAHDPVGPAIHVGTRLVADAGNWVSLDGRAPPRRCQTGDRGIPWDRARDLGSSLQFMSVAWLIVVSASLLLAGWLVKREPVAARLRWGGLATTVASTALFVFVWFG